MSSLAFLKSWTAFMSFLFAEDLTIDSSAALVLIVLRGEGLVSL